MASHGLDSLWDNIEPTNFEPGGAGGFQKSTVRTADVQKSVSGRLNMFNQLSQDRLIHPLLEVIERGALFGVAPRHLLRMLNFTLEVVLAVHKVRVTMVTFQPFRFASRIHELPCFGGE
jgi:hypothetical protein